MNFNSGIFLLYLPIVVILYWILPGKARKYWLLAASYFFYMYWNPLLILLLLASTAIDYTCGRSMERFADDTKKRKAFLLISICMNLGMLFFFKYWDFFAEIMNALAISFHIPYRVPALNLILPVGISFYTFQTMSYSIDVYRGDAPAEHDPIAFALYVSYFPQLVAGPIENPRDLLPQLKAVQELNTEDLRAGFRLLLCGFFRKCVVADLCGIYVNRVYDDIPGANSLTIAIAGSLFCFQMYCDFAGYSEIAAGSARLMGVRLMRNFNRPYISQSYGEFFRRWHISLNRWFTNYLYIPLGGGRKGLARKMFNTLVVFFFCGLWHGARTTYVLWGLYAAFFVCFESLMKKPFENFVERRHIDLSDPMIILIRRTVMFLIFIPAALIFRAESLSQVSGLFTGLFTRVPNLTNSMNQLGLAGPSLIVLALTLIAMNSIHRWSEFDLPPAENNTALAERVVTAASMVLIIALSWLALLSSQDAAIFAYFQF